MTDHTRTEKIGGDSIFLFLIVVQVVAGNGYDTHNRKCRCPILSGLFLFFGSQIHLRRGSNLGIRSFPFILFVESLIYFVFN